MACELKAIKNQSCLRTKALFWGAVVAFCIDGLHPGFFGEECVNRGYLRKKEEVNSVFLEIGDGAVSLESARLPEIPLKTFPPPTCP
jgi:hypothetical protein